jgi:predicted O-methyltransferase YrrM
MAVSDLSTMKAAVSAASYWNPAQDVPSAWQEHAPFAYWLMDAIRPRLIVELGTHNGFSFFVFAEAAKRLGLDARIFALDSWEGDDQAGFYAETVYESVARIAAADYPDTTELVRGYFNDSVSRFEDGSIHLLHIDGRHGYEDVKEDYENYLPKLAEDGVVIFHDTREFQEGFGVHRFWDELAPSAPSFTFHHGHGLGVIAPGTRPPAAVLDFLALANRESDRVRAFYAERGADVGRHSGFSDQLLEIEHLRSELATYGRALEESQAGIASMARSLSWRVTRPLRGVKKLLGGGVRSQTV